MASAEEISGRYTRSGRKRSTSQPMPTTRSTRRTAKKLEEELDEHENAHDDAEEYDKITQHDDGMKEVVADEVTEADISKTGSSTGLNITYEGNQIYEEQLVELDHEEQHIEEELVEHEQQLIEEDLEMYAEPNNCEMRNSEPGLDEKSSSFPFGTVEQSETSEDAMNEEEDASEKLNQSGAAESSLLASLAGDNANSLPSVGGGEETEAKITESLLPDSQHLNSDDSLSQQAIAEDIRDGGDGSDATIVNTELVSEDELPLPTKPEINDAEEVSDEELPAPQRAELPADAEVISEDEFPTGKTSPVPIKSASDTHRHKRKAEDEGSKEEASTNNKTEHDKKEHEEYNPMSPTSESNDAPPVEKKAKIEENESEHKDKKKEKDKEKERDKDKEREKEKERRRLPDLDKYWRAVKEDPADFTGWTYLLQYVDTESDAEAAREAYDAFLSHYPYCYGYWRKYADYEKRKGIKANCNAVFERGLEAIPLSVDLWIHYLAHIKSSNPDNEELIRSQFERAVDACGLEFRSDKLWDAYIRWENEGKRYKRILKIYDRLLAIPTQGYSGHFDSFQDLINQHAVTSTLDEEELKKIRTDLYQASLRAAASVRSKSRRRSSRSVSKDKEREQKDETSNGAGTKSPSQKEASEEVASNSVEVEDEEKAQADKLQTLQDPSTLTDEEIATVKDKVISIRRKVHKATVAAVTARWSFEEGIKRPYFHVKQLERCQLKNWKDYLDFEIEKGDQKRILVLFERCLIACALYDEFWLKMIRYLESQVDQPGIAAITSDVFRRACQIHHPDKPSLHLMWAAFEECQNNFDGAAQALVDLEKKCPNILQIAYRRINIERRRGDLDKCRKLYEHYISTAKNKTIAGSLAIKYARFLNKICNDLDGGLRVLRQALDKDPANTRVTLQMVDLALQRPKVDEDEVVLIMDKFMARENIDPEQKVLFAQRKVEFLEDFGSTAKGLQDAQRSLKLALSKANEAKKKREKSSAAGGGKEGSSTATASAQSTYNNGPPAATAGYGYNSANAAYYGQQNSGAYPQQSYDGYYNHWQYGSSGSYSGYGQWGGYGSYY